MPKLTKTKLLPSLGHRKELHKFAKKCYYCAALGKPDEEWSTWEVHLCNLVAWFGALVVTAVVLRSLYLMYLQPEGA